MVYNQSKLFEYDPHKTLSNKLKHGIDFQEAQRIWSSPYLEIPLQTEDEKRWLIVGKIDNKFWSAIITQRNQKIRIISVRRSRHEEKIVFQKLSERQTDER